MIYLVCRCRKKSIVIAQTIEVRQLRDRFRNKKPYKNNLLNRSLFIDANQFKVRRATILVGKKHAILSGLDLKYLLLH